MRTDIFGLTPRQQDMFGATQASFDTAMTLDEIRAELQNTLEDLRAANVIPWSHRQEKTIRIMFPEIAGRLPEDEARALIDRFEAEIHRLRPAA